MRLRVVRRVVWSVMAVCDDRGECDLFGFLSFPGAYAGGREENMLALLNRAAEQGAPKNRELCAPLGDKIFEFRKSGLRVLFFYDEGRMIICSHGYRKRTQKVGRGEKERAVAAKDEYFKAKSEGRLEILER
jgi:hypothetical protein